LSINQIFVIIQIGLIPSLISLVKYILKERFYKLLYIYIIITYLVELIINRLIFNGNIQVSNIIGKAYMLFEFLILIELMKKISNSNTYIKTLIIFGVGIWLIENIFFIRTHELEKYFNVISSFIVFTIAIYSLAYNLNKNYTSFLKEPNILIIITIIFNISFRIVFEFLYFNYYENIGIMESVNRIYIIVNFSTNILFIYCLSCIKNTKKLISSF
jgi:hypothetical protein